MRVGVDTGGTFTDLVSADGRVTKVPSTPDDPASAVASAMRGLAVRALAHGTTVATNAVLEGLDTVVTLLCTEGLEDIVEIARQDRPLLYDDSVRRPPPLVDRDHRIGVSGRFAVDGQVLVALDTSAADRIPADTEAVAVALLHSDLDASHEREIARIVVDSGYDVSCSSAVAPEFREYERTVTTVLNAALRPVCRRYLSRVGQMAEETSVMASSGGLLDLDVAAELPAALLLSGPAGGVGAAADAARLAGFESAVTFDMGGTSTDVCLVQDGRPEPAGVRRVAGYEVRFPSLDIHTIGAGGGSIAWLDAGGAQRVGPQSAGARPGPACYGFGGAEPTVTDADLVARRIDPASHFGGLELSVDAAEDVLRRAGLDAAGVIEVVNANMERAIRSVTIERGVDPATLALVAFGGAGPLHACDLADALGMAAVVVPARAGALSAVGLLTAPMRREVVRSWRFGARRAGLDALASELAANARLLLPGPSTVVDVAYECRYAGQSHELRVGSPDDFDAEHERRNGFSRPGHDVEVIAVRATATRPSPVSSIGLPATVARPGGTGPLVISESDCTIWVPEGWRADPDDAGNLVVTRA
ncbi:MAG TPA: hydantoinase/oxoprolinase family protein [Acidimicrobiales bacterium]|nr:hydantoinase/oxoprolinase family protein [Acidimicrobiales bacterium]